MSLVVCRNSQRDRSKFDETLVIISPGNEYSFASPRSAPDRTRIKPDHEASTTFESEAENRMFAPSSGMAGLWCDSTEPSAVERMTISPLVLLTASCDSE